jgi:hypothetical protein
MKIKIGTFIDAIEKNGLPQTTGALWRNEFNTVLSPFEFDLKKKNIKSACALGMAFYNLNVNFPDEEELEHVRLEEIIMEWNDEAKMSFQQIAQEYRELYPEKLDQEIEVVPL